MYNSHSKGNFHENFKKYNHERDVIEISLGLELGFFGGRSCAHQSQCGVLGGNPLGAVHSENGFINIGKVDADHLRSADHRSINFGSQGLLLPLDANEEDGAPHDPVTVTWFPHFKVQLTSEKEQTQHDYLLFKYSML